MTVLLLILLLAVFDAAEAARLTFPMESRKVKLPPVDANGLRYVRNPLAALDRRLGAKSSLYSDYPLSGNWSSLALWYMTIDIGKNNQTFHVQVDTGSSDTAIPAVGCNCGHHFDKPFDPNSVGSTAVPCSGSKLVCSCNAQSQCSYTISYGDGSGYTATVYSDEVVFGSTANNGIRLSQQYFGAIVSEVTPSGPFEPPAVDGISGFAQSFLSEVHAPTLIDTLSSENPNCPKQFSLCGNEDRQGGVMTACGYPSLSYNWTPLINFDSQPFYNIHVNGFSANGQNLNVQDSSFDQTIVDSGTTLALIPSKVIQAIKQSIIANCSSNYVVGVCDQSSDATIFDNGNCFSLTPEQAQMYPRLTISAGQANPIDIPIRSTSYIVAGFCADPSQYLCAFQPSDNSGLPGMLIGDPILLTNTVAFDVANQKLGFAEHDQCPQ